MEPIIVVNGKEYPFVTEGDLTLGEAADVERIAGQGYDLSNLGAAGLLALIFISVKRVNGSVTIDEIRELGGEDFDLRLPKGDPIPPPSSGESAGNESTGSSDSSASSEGSPEDSLEPTGTPV